MIVLVNLPPATPEMPPSGLSYLSGAIGSRYYDMNLWLFHNMDKTKWYEQDNEFWLNTLPQSRLIERYARFLAGLKADTYGFSGNKFSIPIFQKTAKYLKAWQKTHIVLGGSAVTSAITLPEADCMFHGDNFDEFIKVSKKKTRGIVSCSLANISAIPHHRNGSP
ncbi:MAG: hypothetical protein HGA85_01185, partial [Nanoarchaeota archaeon]|nr:hypothetical protein [Nanoarchaeota archaeon]